MRRVCIINGRIQEIEAEKDALMCGLGERGASGRGIAPRSAMPRSAEANSFKLKY
jgi:hypothetical protein